MMRIVLQFNLLALLACALALPAAAGSAAEIKEVHVAPKGDQETIDVHLTSSVVPAVIVAKNPDRLVLQFTNTATPNRQQVALVDQNGVQADTDDGTVTMASNGPGPMLGGSVPAFMTAARKSIRTKFTVKYVAEGVAYLNAGRGAGLAPGMKLLVRRMVNAPAGNRQSEVVAQLSIASVAQNSAVA